MKRTQEKDDKDQRGAGLEERLLLRTEERRQAREKKRYCYRCEGIRGDVNVDVDVGRTGCCKRVGSEVEYVVGELWGGTIGGHGMAQRTKW